MTTVNTLDFTYDAAGQMTSASDDNSSYDYTYDSLGRVTYLEIDNGGALVNATQAWRLFPLTETRRHRDRKECFFAKRPKGPPIASEVPVFPTAETSGPVLAFQ
jgi:hypothetical protein